MLDENFSSACQIEFCATIGAKSLGSQNPLVHLLSQWLKFLLDLPEFSNILRKEIVWTSPAEEPHFGKDEGFTFGYETA